MDEIHEQSLESDLALVVLRHALTCHSDFDVVLMSAALEVQPYVDYLQSPMPILSAWFARRGFHRKRGPFRNDCWC